MEQEAIPAATLIVVRDRNASPPQLLMVERSAAMAFAGGAMVFPGGRIDPADRALALGSGESPDAAARIAAIRETLEETGIAVGLAPQPGPALAAMLQDGLIAGQSFAELIEQSELALDLSALIHFARWKPAMRNTRRFDTRFFVACAPRGEWQPRPQAGECEAALWIAADDVLGRIRGGEARAIFPTQRNLERLALYADFESIRSAADAVPVKTITPWIEERGGVEHICIPEDAGYPVTSEPLSSATRG